MSSPSETEEDLLEALGNHTACKVLLFLSERAHPAHDIVHDLNLPQSTVYRILRDLQKKGLVAIEMVTLTNNGRSMVLFRSRVKNCAIELIENKLKVHFRYRDVKSPDGLCEGFPCSDFR